jgi:hypothetical protein
MSDQGQSGETDIEAQRAAFRGAYSLAWLACVVTMTAVFMWVLRHHLEGAGRVIGLLAVSLTSSVLLMLFLSGPLKLLLGALFVRMYPQLRGKWYGDVGRDDRRDQ